jgi:hypothetical protein
VLITTNAKKQDKSIDAMIAGKPTVMNGNNHGL